MKTSDDNGQTTTLRGATDAQKTFGALAVVALALDDAEFDIDELNRQGRQRIGLGWTFMTCMQWLTGKKAWAVIEGLADAGTIAGLSKAHMFALVEMAAQVCQEAGSSAGSEATLARLREAPRPRISS